MTAQSKKAVLRATALARSTNDGQARRGFRPSSVANWTACDCLDKNIHLTIVFNQPAKHPHPLLPDRLTIWQAQARFAASYPQPTLIQRVKFLAAAGKHRQLIDPLLAANPHCLLGRTLRQQASLYDMARAPYICASWTPAQRISNFVAHVAQLETLGPLFSFDVSEEVRLLDLSVIGQGYHLLLDKPIWFHREGVVTLNLFFENTRLFSIAFAISREPVGLTAIVGGIQGRHLPNILDQYRILTKLAHGLRPRDLLIELFRMICRSQGIGAIKAIADSHRHHRSRYFGRDVTRALPLDYDALWLDRGAERIEPAFFHLSIAQQSRDTDEIPARKKSMYRKRYAMLTDIEAALATASVNPRATPVSVSI